MNTHQRILTLTVLALLTACGGGGTDPGGGGSSSVSGTLIFPGQVGGQAAPAKPSSGQPEFVPGEVIVKFRSGVTLQSLQGLRVQVAAGSVQLERVRSLGLERTDLFKTSLNAAATLELIAQLSARRDVEYAEPNYISRAMKTSSDPIYPLQWHYAAMNLPNAWDITDGTTGSAVTVAVVDTGSITHPDLAGMFVGGYDFISDATEAGDGGGRDANSQDLGGDSGYHGSHVGGTVAARNNGVGGVGVSWGAKVVPVRVLGINGSGTSSDILDGVRWAAGLSVSGVPTNANPAKVINLSLGGKRACSQTEQTLYTQLKIAGVIVVVAAGNDNDNAALYSPASCDDVITVGATGPTGERAPYSNYGAPVDVMAPGGDTQKTLTVGGETFPAGVISTVLDQDGRASFAAYNGTSMAAPHIAGVIALMLSRDPNLSFVTVLARLRSAGAPLSSANCNSPIANGCGSGLVDAAKAVSATGGGGGRMWPRFTARKPRPACQRISINRGSSRSKPRRSTSSSNLAGCCPAITCLRVGKM
jgi:serine protease